MGAAFCRCRGPAAFAVLATLGLIAPVRAQEEMPPGATDEFSLRRSELEAEMRRLSGQIERIERRELGLLQRLERLRLDVQLREREVAASDLEIRRLERAVDRLQFEIERVSERLERRRSSLAGRLRALYRRGPLLPARALGVRADSGEWVRAMGLLEHLARRDARQIEALRADTAALARSLEARKLALQQQEQERRRAELRRLTLARAMNEHHRLLESVRGDRDMHRAAYEEIQAAAAELDSLIRGVGEGRTPSAAPESAWVSLGAFRGILERPVDGPVRIPFGDVRHPRFQTLTPHRGLSFEAARRAPVRAVFEGEVVFSDWLRGYGHTVILDHHHGYLTVYAHLDEPRVRVGERVARGGVLGQAGESGSLEGPQLYFELRRDGLPLDPSPWLGAGQQRARLGGER
jgi:septal ring factor EnvC (AmiA/AmiB activator)